MQAHARGSGSRANDVASRTVPVPRVGVALARNASEVEEAQRLRYAVFAEELGARLPETQLSAARRIDRDAFDPYCEHLIARDLGSGEVVGTYRILTPDAARAAGSYYSEQEFDLARLAHLRAQMVEVGRSCVHPDYRSGGAILMLWSALIRFMGQRGHEYLFGCASMGMADGGHAAAATWRRVQARHLAAPEYRVFPHCRLPVEALDAESVETASQPNHRALPPLIKGYLNIGARICGEPAWDPDFNTADLPVLLSVSNMTPRYKNHLVKNVIT